jgi:hypothetical protein
MVLMRCTTRLCNFARRAWPVVGIEREQKIKLYAEADRTSIGTATKSSSNRSPEVRQRIAENTIRNPAGPQCRCGQGDGAKEVRAELSPPKCSLPMFTMWLACLVHDFLTEAEVMVARPLSRPDRRRRRSVCLAD